MTTVLEDDDTGQFPASYIRNSPPKRARNVANCSYRNGKDQARGEVWEGLEIRAAQRDWERRPLLT